jgi:hypothetical protein
MSFLEEFLRFLLARKTYWLLPILALMESLPH